MRFMVYRPGGAFELHQLKGDEARSGDRRARSKQKEWSKRSHAGGGGG